VKVALGGSLLPWWFADPAGDVKETAAPLITTASDVEGTSMTCPATVAVAPAVSVDLAPLPWMMTAPLLDVAVKAWPSCFHVTVAWPPFAGVPGSMVSLGSSECTLSPE
jgi:hypothetical protein